MHKDLWNIKRVFCFLVKFAVRAEQRGHKEMIGTLCSQHGEMLGQ